MVQAVITITVESDTDEDFIDLECALQAQLEGFKYDLVVHIKEEIKDGKPTEG